MRIIDWSSDVCSSDLDRRADLSRHRLPAGAVAALCGGMEVPEGDGGVAVPLAAVGALIAHVARHLGDTADALELAEVVAHIDVDRQSVVAGTSEYVRLASGGRRIIKKNKLTLI